MTYPSTFLKMILLLQVNAIRKLAKVIMELGKQHYGIRFNL